jgi:hypothetical protein
MKTVFTPIISVYNDSTKHIEKNYRYYRSTEKNMRIFLFNDLITLVYEELDSND